ncbi:hypothetical protein [Peristeroidobacter soli]|uniref:hypothetical protein n=1 Tax=Peristeroidobacter soli TaxID=2497877 RepID=UPI00101B7E19|nr:hypothetical protein [Peristeroidobacter soli]
MSGALSPQLPLPFLVIAAAIAVLVALRFDLRYAVGMAFTAGLSASWVVLSLARPGGWLVFGVGVLFFGPMLLGWLLRQTGSLNLAFQVALLSMAVLLIGLFVVLPDPVGIWREQLELAWTSMAKAGLRIEGDREVIIAAWARTMWGGLAALSLGTVFGAVLLGRWWQSLLDTPGSFGVEYRQLRLGRAMGIATTLLFIVALLTDSALVASLAWVAFAALAFQGLAAAHRSKAVGRLDRGWLVAIYVLLIVLPVTSFVVLMLAIWGFADNWLRPRTRSA